MIKYDLTWSCWDLDFKSSPQVILISPRVEDHWVEDHWVKTNKVSLRPMDGLWLSQVRRQKAVILLNIRKCKKSRPFNHLGSTNTVAWANGRES